MVLVRVVECVQCTESQDVLHTLLDTFSVVESHRDCAHV